MPIYVAGFSGCGQLSADSDSVPVPIVAKLHHGLLRDPCSCLPDHDQQFTSKSAAKQSIIVRNEPVSSVNIPASEDIDSKCDGSDAVTEGSLHNESKSPSDDVIVGNLSRHMSSTAADVAVMWNNIYILTSDGQLVTTGADVIGENACLPQEFLKICCSQGLRSVCCGWRTVCVVDKDNSYCHIWDTSSNTTATVSESDFGLEEFALVKTNDILTFAVTVDRRLLLITRHDPGASLTVRTILSGLRVKTVSCGNHHALILSAIGVVFSVGVGGQGQLGHGTIDSEAEPRIVEALEGLTMLNVSAGGWHSLALSDVGDVYVWGWNERGQLGLPCRAISCNIGIPCGMHQTHERAACRNIADNNEPCDVGTEGNEDHFVNVLTIPHVLDLPVDSDEVAVTKIACGSRHTVVLADDGTVMAWGWNAYGQLGVGDVISRDTPTVISFFREQSLCVTEVFAGRWNSIFVCQ